MDLFLYDRDLRLERIIWSLNDFKYFKIFRDVFGTVSNIYDEVSREDRVNSFYPLTIFIKAPS